MKPSKLSVLTKITVAPLGATELLAFLVSGPVHFADLAISSLAPEIAPVSPRTYELGAYRVYDMDYSDGTGSQKFGFDTTQHGPFAGLSYRF